MKKLKLSKQIIDNASMLSRDELRHLLGSGVSGSGCMPPDCLPPLTGDGYPCTRCKTCWGGNTTCFTHPTSCSEAQRIADNICR